jgi:threonylcarbamoyladenosine tRNA methylthiotransferase MtaB
VLKRMARRHHQADFVRICTALKQAIPGVCIGSDIIVGFPGETEADYATTRQCLQQTAIDYFHVFSYSKRKNTPAAVLPHQVPQRVIQWRSRDLSALSEAKWLAYRQQQAQQPLAVIMEQDGRKGMSAEYIRVQLEGHLPALTPNTQQMATVTKIEGDRTWVTV